MKSSTRHQECMVVRKRVVVVTRFGRYSVIPQLVSVLLLWLVICCYCNDAIADTTTTASATNTVGNIVEASNTKMTTCIESNLNEEGIPDGTCLPPSTTTTTSNNNDMVLLLHLPPPDCQVYIAKSTIPNAGLGIFNGPTPKRTGDDVLNQHTGGDVCIPFIDTTFHDYDRDDPQLTTATTNPLLNYFWAGFALGLYTHSIYYQGTEVSVFCPGFDTMINCHLGIGHLLSTSIPQYDDLSVPILPKYQNHHQINQERYHRSTHPGSGAFTPYFNGTSKVKAQNVYIPPYTELFKDYGDHWFEDRVHIFGNIPLSDDYYDIFPVLQHFATLRKDILLSSTTTPALHVQTENVFIDLYETLLLHLKDIYDSRTLNALPPTFQDAVYIGSSNTIETMTNYLMNQHTTNFEYLQEYGTCIDQIRPGRSTLSNAGHGGFATRLFRTGTIITASPLLIIPDERLLYMYNFTKYNHTWYRDYKKRKHYQLIYNYCYGHDYSTVLLCPHGGGINYINHNQSLVNVKMEWTTTQLSYMHNTTLVMNGTIEELKDLAHMQQGSQLVFQYVAIRDIQPNEELFLDYGNAWEEAWQYHVQHYPYSNQDSKNNNKDKSDPPYPKYISAHEYNYYHQDALIRTIDEQKVEPYPKNLQIRCHRSLYSTYSNAFGIYEWTGLDYGLPCRILDRWIETSIIVSSFHMDLYTVQIEYVPTHNVAEHHYDDDVIQNDTSSTAHSAIWVTRTDVPRSAIRFFDTPYTTDIHQPSAFRHYISIADDIFPTRWKNLQ